MVVKVLTTLSPISLRKSLILFLKVELSFSEMAIEEKNRFSHKANAIQKFADLYINRW